MRVRAEEFRAHAAESAIPHFSDLMSNGAAQLEERARMLEARVTTLVPAEFELLPDINGAD